MGTEEEVKLRVVALGDFGEHLLVDPESGRKLGNTVAQRFWVRNGIADLARKPDVGLFLGDNFYPVGIQRKQGVQREQWRDLVATYGPLEIPFLAVLGNHDHMGDVQAQVDFSTSPGNPTVDAATGNRLWNMPARYYDKRVGPIHFFCFDTEDTVHASEQVAFMEQRARASDAPWKVAVGHVPCCSDYRGRLREVDWVYSFTIRHCQVYLSGHCHSLQVLNLGRQVGAWENEDKTERSGPVQVVSGAGGNHYNVRFYPHNNAVVRSMNRAGAGFTLLDVCENELIIRHVVAHGSYDNDLVDKLETPVRREQLPAIAVRADGCFRLLPDESFPVPETPPQTHVSMGTECV